jgi:hypothetical protein
MSDHSLDEFIFQLTEAHALLNEKLFNGQLNKIKISVERPKRTDSRIKGFMQSGGNMYGGDTAIITITTSTLNGNFENVINTLVHEMIHQYNSEHGIIDTYATNPRHNKQFKKTAEMVGWRYVDYGDLVTCIDKGKRKRFGFSDPSYFEKEYLDTINSLAIDQNLIKNFVHGDSLRLPDEKKKMNFYKCPGCEVTVRSQGELNFKCLDCDQKLIKTVKLRKK